MAAQVLGFVGYDGNDLTGRYGLEKYYNGTLARDNSLNENFFAEMFSDLSSAATGSGNREGDLTTTIEPTVQSNLESELQKIDDVYSPSISGGIIINPVTGEIYAMAAAPSFNPNTFNTETNPSVFRQPTRGRRIRDGFHHQAPDNGGGD